MVILTILIVFIVFKSILKNFFVSVNARLIQSESAIFFEQYRTT